MSALVRNVLDASNLNEDELSQVFFASSKNIKYFSSCVDHVKNAGKRVFLAAYKGEMPITTYCDSPSARATYVSTTQSHYVDYGWDEVVFHTDVNSDSVCFINSSLVSTNLYKDESEVARDFDIIIKELNTEHRKSVCIFRNLDCIGTPNLLGVVKHNINSILVASRVVNHLDTSEDSIWDHKHCQRDAALVEKHIGARKHTLKEVMKGTRTMQSIMDECREQSTSSSHILRLLSADEPLDVYFRLEQLYSHLYLEKYSKHNPQYSAAFFRNVANVWTIVALQRRDTGIIEGFMCMNEVGGIVTNPALGYDMASKTPSYIILQFWAMLEAKSRKKHLNMSGGVTKYKQARGAIPVLEYSGVWLSPSLGWRPRIFWLFLSGVTRYIVQPLLARKNIK